MNSLVFIIPSNMKNQGEVLRVLESVDVSQNIFVYFINQSSNNIGVNELYEVNQCHLIEIKTGKIIPLSQSRNLALNEVVNATFDERTLVMFIDDDAWFPRETIDFLLSLIFYSSFRSRKRNPLPVNHRQLVRKLTCFLTQLRSLPAFSGQDRYRTACRGMSPP